MDVDKILEESSFEVFGGLEEGQLRILRFIAKNGLLNLRELGQLTSKYASGFDRWGVRKRLEGTSKFLGLILNDYVTKIRINKKETKYGLTLKGMITCLSFMKFEDIYLISHYKQILMNYSQDDSKVELILSFIKNEIANLLYYNYIQGINWLKFRFLKSYLNHLRDYNTDSFYLHIEIDLKSLQKTERSTYDWLKKLYGDTYQLAIHSAGYIDPNKVYRDWIKKLKQESSFNPKIKGTIALFIYLRLWSELIDEHKKEMNVSQLVGAYLDFHRFDYGKSIVHMPKKDLEIIFGRGSNIKRR